MAIQISFFFFVPRAPTLHPAGKSSILKRFSFPVITDALHKKWLMYMSKHAAENCHSFIFVPLVSDQLYSGHSSGYSKVGHETAWFLCFPYRALR